LKKTKKILFAIAAFVSLFGLFVGPYAWYTSATYYGKLNELEKTGTKTNAIVDSREEKRGFRATYVCVNIHYTEKQTGKVISRERINLNHGYFDDLRIGQSIPIYYKGKDVVLLDDYKTEYLPPIKWRYWGMIYTLLSYSFITGVTINTQRKRKKINQATRDNT